MSKILLAFLLWLFATGKYEDWKNLIFPSSENVKPEGDW